LHASSIASTAFFFFALMPITPSVAPVAAMLNSTPRTTSAA